MQALIGWLTGNTPWKIVAAAIALFVAALLILLVFRLAFGRRLRMSGGRARQLRLGIVDAFDLDRQRQLVIVRRDNIEHLIMIGGPNDILIESQIVRAEARDLREPRGRDKEIRDKEFKEPPQMPPAAPLKPPIVEPKFPLPPLMPEPQQPAAAEDLAPVMRSTPTPLQPVNRAPMPPPRRMPLHPDLKPLPMQQPEPLPRAEAKPTPAAAAPPDAVAAPNQPPATPGFLRWPARPGYAPSAAKPPSATSVPPSAAPAVPPPPPPTPEAPAAAEPSAQDAMESLEEEMAKLLGRGPGKS